MAKKRGGKRPGAGRKRGKKNSKTVEKEESLEVYKSMMRESLLPFVRSQQELATGLVVVLRPKLVKNPKTGKLERTGELKQVKNPDEIEMLFNSNKVGEDYHVVFGKDPNVKALADIFDRIFGKPKETIEIPGQQEALLAIQKSNLEILKVAKVIALRKLRKARGDAT